MKLATVYVLPCMQPAQSWHDLRGLTPDLRLEDESTGCWQWLAWQRLHQQGKLNYGRIPEIRSSMCQIIDLVSAAVSSTLFASGFFA